MSKIGLVSTVTASYSEPFTVTRQFVSLDPLSDGRIGWNVVASAAGGENFNVDGYRDHADRHERAHKFVDVVTGLWDNWADDAFVQDKATG